MTRASELQDALVASRQRLLQTIAGVSEEQFKRRPPVDEGEQSWCIAEVLTHLLLTERLRAEQIELALQQDGAELPPLDPQAQDQEVRAGRHAPVPQLIHGLLAVRRQIERLLDRANAAEGGLERAVVHPRAGRLTVEALLRTRVLDHEAEHADQIEALRLQVGAPPVRAV